mmetsp:Transcript_17091/g.48842  ORF Transcript_17091/g.48842 Transcript_17091/m.48842 type:complete len:250 (+) Transcript_17091:86-835(+)
MGLRARMRRKVEARRLALRERCIHEHAAMEAVERHWADADGLLRQVDAKDSIFELERIRGKILEDFRKNAIAPIETSVPKSSAGVRSQSDERFVQNQLKNLLANANGLDDFQLLRRLYFAAATLDVYQRHTRDMMRTLERAHRDHARKMETMREHIETLSRQVHNARRKDWCQQQTKRWRPLGQPETQAKQLAAEGGPRSAYFDPRVEASGPSACAGGIARIVGSLQIDPYDHTSRMGRSFSDAISRKF